MCKGQGGSSLEVQGKKDKTTNECEVEGRDFEKVGGLE